MNEQSPIRPVKELIEEYNRQLMDTYRRQSPPPAPLAQNWLEEQFPMPDIERDKAALAVNTSVQSAEASEGNGTQPTERASQNPAEMLPDTLSPNQPLSPEIPPPSVAEPPENPAPNPSFPYEDGDLQQRPPYPTEDLSQEPTPETPATPYIGYLRVFVFTGQTTEPLEGARVVITRRQGDGNALYANTTTDMDGQTPVIPLPSVDPNLTLRPDVTRPYVAYDIRVSADGFSSALYRDVPVYGGNYVTQPAAMLPLLPGEDPSVPRIYYSGGPADL